ncbi:MAG: nuclear transport factor 2 family protein [Erythrobacter sp.]
MSAFDHGAVMDLLASYFDGLQRADPGILRAVFHPDLGYVNATQGEYVAKGLDEYLEDIAGRPPSPANPERRVIQIAQIDEDLVFVHATVKLMNRHYRDALTLIRTDNRWQIVSKVFSFTEQGEN